MLLGSVKEALSYGANTFMFYTGAPQNTRRKAISELKVEEAKTFMHLILLILPILLKKKLLN